MDPDRHRSTRPTFIPGRGVRLAVVGSVALLAAACSQPVAVPAPHPSDARVAEICQRLSLQLPVTLAGQDRRPTDPTTNTVAAWGAPPITLRCGVDKPAGLHPTSEVLSINGVDWFAEQRTAGWVFTTSGRIAYIEVAVPQDYRPETDVLVDLAGLIADQDPTG